MILIIYSNILCGSGHMQSPNTLEVFTLVDKTAQGVRQCENHPDALMRIVPGSVRGKVSPICSAAKCRKVCEKDQIFVLKLLCVQNGFLFLL